MCVKSSVDFVDCVIYTIQYNNQIQQSQTNFNNRCQKLYVDFVDSGWPEPKIWALENNVDYVAPKAQKLIFDNMCEKSYVDFVDSGWPEPKIWALENNVDFVAP